MMGGGFFNNMWDPYNGVHGYPQTQPRARYNRPHAPIYDQYGSFRVPENRFSAKIDEPVSGKAARTIPVTDGSAPVPVLQKVSQAEVQPPLAVKVKPMGEKLKRGDVAATKIQALYRGHSVRKTQPLKHLRVIKKVEEELANFKRKLQETEQKKKLRSDPKERLKWTEGIMSLLLRLDSLQGVHPTVRLIRKALTKELIGFQEKVDSMSSVPEEVDGKEIAIIGENIDNSGVAKVIEGDTDCPAAEVVEKMEVEESNPAEQDVAHVEASKNPTFEKRVPKLHLDKCHEFVNSVASNFHNQSEPLVDEHAMEEVEFALEPSFTEANVEGPSTVDCKAQTSETMKVPAPAMEEVEVVSASSQYISTMDVEPDNQEVFREDRSVATAPSRDFIPEPMTIDRDSSVAPASSNSASEVWHQVHDMGRGENAEWLTGDLLVLDASAPLEERKTFTGSMDPDEWGLIPACPAQSPSSETQCIKSLQVGQPQSSITDDSSALSEHALLQQLLEENQTLRDIVGKVLQWGKQQNNDIRCLLSRIEQLEKLHLQPNLLHSEVNKSRKRIGNRGRSHRRAEKGGRR